LDQFGLGATQREVGVSQSDAQGVAQRCTSDNLDAGTFHKAKFHKALRYRAESVDAGYLNRLLLTRLCE